MAPPAGGHRPRTLLLTLLGRHVLGRGGAVSAGTLLACLERLGVSHHAGRSTLTRMVGRGLLTRRRRGRHAYYELTPACQALLADGARRIFAPAPVRHGWDGHWTLLSFSIPESRRHERHRLRARLAWHNFGLLRDGLWLAPGRIEPDGLLADLGVDDHVQVFTARALAPADPAALLAQAFDLDGLRQGYEAFLADWSDPGPLGDSCLLAQQVALVTDWRLLVREDPLLPVEHLPAGWPALRAARLFHRLHDRCSPGAEQVFRRLLVTAPPAPP